MTGSAEGSVYKSIVKDALRLPWGWSVGGAANTRFFSTRIDRDGGRLVLTKFSAEAFSGEASKLQVAPLLRPG